MFTVAINLGIIDIIALLMMAIVLGIIVHFVMVNKRNLQTMIEESRKLNSLSCEGEDYIDKKDDKKKAGETAPERKLNLAVSGLISGIRSQAQKISIPRTASTPKQDTMAALKENMELQKKAIEQLVARFDRWENPDLAVDNRDNVEDMEALLEEQEAEAAEGTEELELQKLKQQLSTSQKMTARIDDVYKEFEALQQKIATLEQTAGKANDLMIELDALKQTNAQTKKDLTRKQEKLQQLMVENQDLQERLNETEDKLSEANLERQQLTKKLQFLENMHNEVQRVSEANKKLQNDLRRIGELESMLSMVSGERDMLLKKRTS